MSKQAHDPASADIERLIREGELYRIKVVHAKALVAQAIRPDALMHGALDHVASLAQARLGGLMPPGGLSNFNYKALMPYALTVGSFLARKRLIKPVLGVAALAGVGVAWLLKRKRSAS
ncbi:hypothetical protein ASF61_18825 [Duganella sp. Leaf126]|uniref:hypothetical protein n=1 Tax=Duganella sp. Leaf126 TaxID=1736266 RepID=UPI0006F58D72|nr:hypothetical protein [Duganella sp. Leaf126]KQQ45731.1 hypothetical protein ASF61_18825 [Duganella sp. Leaf126]